MDCNVTNEVKGFLIMHSPIGLLGGVVNHDLAVHELDVGSDTYPECSEMSHACASVAHLSQGQSHEQRTAPSCGSDTLDEASVFVTKLLKVEQHVC